MRYTVSFTGKQNGVPVSLTLAVDADTVEKAWDAFKQKSGLRRWPGDEPPTIEAADGADISTENES